MHFGKPGAKRTQFGAKEGPGPGEYEPYKTGTDLIVENLNIQDGGDRTRFDSKIPRYHELVEREEQKKVWCIILVIVIGS